MTRSWELIRVYEHMHVVMLKMKIDPRNIGADGVCDVGKYDWLIAAGCIYHWQTTLQQTCAAETFLKFIWIELECDFRALGADTWRVCLWQGANILLTDNGYVKLGERNTQGFCDYLLLQKTESEQHCLLNVSLSLCRIIISALTLTLINSSSASLHSFSLLNSVFFTP